MAEDITGILIETDDILGTVDDINVTGAVYEQVSLVTYVDTAVSDVLSGDFTPTSLTTSGRKFAILLTYAGTLPFGGVFEIWASDSNDRTVATHVDDSSALTYLHSGLDLVDTKYYWIRVRDMYGANSSWYPSSATAGVSGTTSTDASDYLDLLIGNISEDQLVDELKTRINLIDRDYIYEEGVFEQSDPFDPFTMVFAGIDKLVDALISDNATNISDINDLISTTLTHAAEIAAMESEITSLTTSEWQNDQSYTVGRYVVYNDTVYRCTQAYTYPPAKEPGVDTDYWEEADSIVTLVSDVESRVDVLEGTITDKVGSTEFNALENRVTVNEAAITVNSADILLRVEQSDFDAFSVLVFPEYDSGDTYVINDIVQHDGKTYKCILTIDFSPAPDPSNATYWEEVDFTHEFQTAVSQIDVNADNITLSSSAIVGDVTYLFALEADRSYETGVYVETVGDIDGLDLTITQAGIDIDGAQADILIHTSQISGLDSRLSQAEIDIDGAEAAIVLRASQSSLDATNANVTAAGIRLDGHDASISAQALQISTLESTTGTHTTQISQAQVDIDAAEAAILLRATKTEIDGTLAPEWSAVVTYTAGEQVRYYSTQYDLYKCILTSPAGTLPTNDTYWTKLGLIGGRVSQAEADIDAAEASIALKASQSSLDSTNANVTAAGIRLDGHDASISAQAIQISTLESTTGTHTTQISQAQADINAAQASILLHTSQISTLQDTTGTHTAQIAQAQIDINTAESNIADGQAGTWSSISSKATTATVSAIDIRLSTAESDISAGQAGTWASITNKLGIATYDADQKVGGVLRIGEAEEAITVLEGDNNSIKAQYTLKLNVNDRVAGFGLMLSDDEPSEFAIVADRFIIVDPDIDGNESVPFIVGDIGGVHTVGINGNLIVDGSILAQSIGANEIVTSAANIKDLAVTNAKINDLNAAKINAGYLSADRIEAGTLTGAKISAATTITAGSGNNVAVLTGDDATYRMYAGNASPGSAPFSVKKTGELYCSSGKVEGSFAIGGLLSNNSLFRVGWMQDRGTILGGPGSYSFSDYQRTLSGFFIANSTYIITELYYQFFKSGGYSSSSTDSITFWLTYNGVALCAFSGSLSPAQYESAWYNGLVGLYGVNSTPAQNSIFSPIITNSTTALVEHLSASGASGGGGMVVGVRLRIAGFRIETNPFPSTGWGTGIWEG